MYISINYYDIYILSSGISFKRSWGSMAGVFGEPN